MSHHSVYVFESAGLFKVGMSGDVGQRIRNISASSPLKVNLIFSICLKNKILAFRVERSAHKKLKRMGLHSHFEWFLPSSKNYVVKAVLDSASEICTLLEEKKTSIIEQRRLRGPRRPIKKLAEKEKEILKEVKNREVRRFLDSLTEEDRIRHFLRDRDFRKVSENAGLERKQIRNFFDGKISLDNGSLKKLSDYLEK